MNLENLKAEVKKDLTIDKTDLASESIRIPQIHNKYLNFLMKAINNLNWNIRSAIDWMRMTEFAG